MAENGLEKISGDNGDFIFPKNLPVDEKGFYIEALGLSVKELGKYIRSYYAQKNIENKETPAKNRAYERVYIGKLFGVC